MGEERKDEMPEFHLRHEFFDTFHITGIHALWRRNDGRTEANDAHVYKASDDKTGNYCQNISKCGVHKYELSIFLLVRFSVFQPFLQRLPGVLWH